MTKKPAKLSAVDRVWLRGFNEGGLSSIAGYWAVGKWKIAQKAKAAAAAAKKKKGKRNAK